MRDYFGLENKISLISHHDFEKNFEQLKSTKDLIYPTTLYDTVVFLQKNISDFRDDEIVHKTNPRTIKGTTHNSKHVGISRTRIYPNERDNQVESLPLTELKDSLDRYVEQIILLIKTNRNKSKFQIHK